MPPPNSGVLKRIFHSSTACWGLIFFPSSDSRRKDDLPNPCILWCPSFFALFVQDLCGFRSNKLPEVLRRHWEKPRLGRKFDVCSGITRLFDIKHAISVYQYKLSVELAFCRILPLLGIVLLLSHPVWWAEQDFGRAPPHQHASGAQCPPLPFSSPQPPKLYHRRLGG